MKERTRFTEEELAIAKSTDLTEIAAALGYTVRKIGKYHTLKEMDSIRIYNRSHWYRWSRQYEKGKNGGSQIDFLRVFAGMDVKEAVFWLLDYVGYSKDGICQEKLNINKESLEAKEKKKSFILPDRADNNRYLYDYLQKERGISKEVIDFFITRNLIYESKKHHNIVFVGNDKEEKPRFASMRGVFDRQGKAFKCDVEGNDKRYGFHLCNPENKEIVVFEAAIDLMSYVEMHHVFHRNLLALGMLDDAPLQTFLAEHPQIESIQFALDNDVPGRAASQKMLEKYFGLGYEVEDISVFFKQKDYNEWLLYCKNNIPMSNEIRESDTRSRTKTR